MRTKHPKRQPLSIPAGTPMLELDDVQVNYGGIKALKGVKLRVDPGEIVALIGSNGAGKTTVFNLITGV